jgi:hypothetical protein
MNQPGRPAFHPASASSFPRAATPQPSMPGRPAVALSVPFGGQPGAPRPGGPGRPHTPQPGGQGTPPRPYAPPARPVGPQPPYTPPRQYVPQPAGGMSQPAGGMSQPAGGMPYAPPAQGRPAQPPAPRPAAPIPAPVPPMPPAAAESEPLGPPPRPRKGKIGRVIALIVIVGGIGGAVWYGTHTAPASAAVGDCVTQTGSDSLAKVSCGDKAAQFKVDGRLDNKTMVDASLDACAAFPKATSAYWEGESGKPGLVLCLEPVVPVPAAK